MDVSGTQGSMGKDQFMQLLVTQLKYQDPLNPMDNTQFATQLAQFSSLEQLTNISTQMDNLLTVQNSLGNTLTASFIGKNVAYGGDQEGSGTVTGVSYDNDITYLIVNGNTKIRLSDIKEISG
ncbi:MAG TPA: flagellar hook capping FlgD N-terminal domain-containing protein [Thermodesulfovibrionales bacterium]|nr:flagellar hook capping FlgD N-terminal domain-containing protein [Thermodesulfovibrionales bacterium]